MILTGVEALDRADARALDRLVLTAAPLLAPRGAHVPSAAERITDALADPERRLYVVGRGEALAGFIELERNAPGPGTITIAAIVVDPAARGRGIGRGLVEAALAGEDQRAVEAGVLAGNTGALAFFAALGLEAVGPAEGGVTIVGAELPLPQSRSTESEADTAGRGR